MSDIKISYQPDRNLNRKSSRMKIVVALITAVLFILFYLVLFRELDLLVIPFAGVMMIIVLILPLSMICETYFAAIRPFFRVVMTLVVQVLAPTFIVFLFDAYSLHFYGFWGVVYLFNSFLFFVIDGMVQIYKVLRSKYRWTE